MKIGILGAGQLARMMALAAYPLGMQTVCFDPVTDSCAGKVTKVIQGDYHDQQQLRDFAEQVDCITIETENIPLATAEFVSQICPFFPSLNALKTGQDRLFEKNLFTQLNIATPRFYAIHSEQELIAAIGEINFPAVLKTRRMGYDGKGQAVLRTAAEATSAWQTLGNQELILEEFIVFTREVSLISVRSKTGEICFYPLVENQHHQGILRTSLAPFMDPTLQQQAQIYAQDILNTLDYTGVLAIEFFQVGQQLLANEMAPRVHNTGHWTIEGADTSQFENHLRAITGLPLGGTAARGVSAMLNCIGTMPALADVLKVSGAHYHSYEKSPRPQRKLGHVTLTVSDEKQLSQPLRELQTMLSTDL